MPGTSTNEEFWFPLYNGEPEVIAAVSGLAAVAWLLLAVPLLLAGFIRLRSWRPRNWRRTAAWAGAWVAGFALMILAWVACATSAPGSGTAGVGWGELPIFAAWLALGAAINQILSTPAHDSVLRGAACASAAQTCSAIRGSVRRVAV